MGCHPGASGHGLPKDALEWRNFGVIGLPCWVDGSSKPPRVGVETGNPIPIVLPLPQGRGEYLGGAQSRGVAPGKVVAPLQGAKVCSLWSAVSYSSGLPLHFPLAVPTRIGRSVQYRLNARVDDAPTAHNRRGGSA